MEKREIALKVVSYATPYPMIARVAKSLVRSGKAVAEAMPKAKKAEAQDGESAQSTDWDKMSGQERFRHAYAEGGWTEAELLKQYGAFRAAKFVQLLVGLALLPALVGVAVTAPLWIVMFSIPVMAAFSVVLLAQSLRHAWWQCQLDLRSMIAFKEFVGRSDLFGRLFA